MAAVLDSQPFDWHRPDYRPVFAARLERLRRLRARPELMSALRAHYAARPWAFLDDWACVAEPRNAPLGLSTTIPLVLWPRQRELLEWIFERWQRGEPGVVAKSRDSGVSWLTVCLGITLALFYPGTVIGYGSRKVELVDGTPKSLFAKARFMLRNLPAEFLPPGFNLERDAPFMRIVLPNGSSLTGEGGTQLGRGDRTSLHFIDEAAFLEDEAAADAALSQTTRCRIDVSTPHGRTGGFAEKFHGGRVSKFVFTWRDNPMRDEAWYQRQRETLPPAVLAQEVDVDFAASVEGILIPAAWAQAAVGAAQKLGIKPTGTKCLALDVADEGDNRCALAGRYGVALTHLRSWSGKGSDLYASVVKAFAIADEWGFETLEYDSDGLGCGVRGIAGAINEERAAAGRQEILTDPYRGSGPPYDPEGEMMPGRTNQDLFLNLKAMSWWSLRMRFEATWRAVIEGKPPADPEMLISIDPALPELHDLLVELSQPTFTTTAAGKLQVVKTPPGTKSPDRADAVCIAFGPASRAAWAATWIRLAG